jgi:SPP1 gp7 family putative phage head morphogenesis protein
VPNANEQLFDELIRHQVYVERYKQSQLVFVQQLLAQLAEDVAGQLGRYGADLPASVRSAQLQALLENLGRLSDTVADEMSRNVQSQMQDLIAYEGGFMAGAARVVLPAVVSFTTVSPATLWAAATERPFDGRLMSDWFRDYSVNQRKRLTDAIRMGVVEGETVDKLIRRVRGTKRMNGRDGVIQGITQRGAEALVRTAVNHTVTVARNQTFIENAAVISECQWRSTLDGKTSEICIARDGKTYPLDSGPRPPAHPNCRSTIVPVLKSWKQLGINLSEAPEGTRASMNGQVPSSETYPSWLKRQPAAFQDEVLGVTKGQLFRSGKLTVDKFVDEQLGRGYTLDELRAKHPEAFA